MDAPVEAPSSTPDSAPSNAPAPTPSAAAAPSAAAPVPSSTAQRTSTPDSPFAEQPGEGGADAAAKAAQAEAERRYRFKLKVDGQEREEEFDEATLTARLQKGLAAEKRMQEAAELKKKFNEALEFGKKDPFEAMKTLFGVDAREHVERQLLEEYERQQREAEWTPEQRQLHEMEQRLQEREAELQRIQQEREAQIREQAEIRAAQDFENKFVEAIEAADLPRTPQTIAMMAEIERENLAHNLDLTPAQLAAEVRDRLASTNQRFVRGLKGERLVKFLGDDTVNEIRQYLVEQARSRRGTAAPAPAASQPAAERDGRVMPRHRDSAQEWRRFVRGG